MLEGLAELPDALSARGVGFVLRVGPPPAEVARFCGEVAAALLVGDENPLREPERWRRQVADAVRIPFWTADADVVVPGTLLEKEQWSAGTMRPRVVRQLDLCLRPSAAPKARIAWRAPRGLARVVPRPEAARRPACRSWRLARARLARRPAGRCRTSRAVHPEAARRLLDLEEPAGGGRDERSVAVPPLRAAGPARDRAGGPRRGRAARGSAGLHRATRHSPRTGRQLREIQSRVRPGRVGRPLGGGYAGPPPRRPSRVDLHGAAARAGRDARSALERRAAPDGRVGVDARLSADVLGQEDPRVVRIARGRDGRRDRVERPVSTRRPRPERLHRHRLGDRRQARPRLGPRAADLRDDSLHVARQHVAEVRQPHLHRPMVY